MNMNIEENEIIFVTDDSYCGEKDGKKRNN